jgi:hypothetical protein
MDSTALSAGNQPASTPALAEAIVIPKMRRGRPTPEKTEAYNVALQVFADRIVEIRSSLDFAPSARGWCYILEEFGLTKDNFDTAGNVIVECRKRGFLPLDITATDSARAFQNDENVFDGDADEFVEQLLWWAHDAVDDYCNHSFWEEQDYFCQMVVEKIDLKALFLPTCERFRVRIANARGWSDLHMRADMMRQFQHWEDRGKTPVLLYCGDFDPAGVLISDQLLNNLQEIEDAVGWDPGGLVIDRFGLNLDFIEDNELSWINNLMTGGKKDLADPGHKQHQADHVQRWLREIGKRKVEANALVTRPNAGRQLCYDAITKYVDADAPDEYASALQGVQGEARGILEKMTPDGPWSKA